VSAEPAVLPATLRLGPVQLTVPDLDRSVGFYQDALGLRVQDRDDGAAALGAGGDALVVLHERPGARRAGRHAGLYHFALLFPDRRALARALGRLAVTRTPLDGASDHGVSEALYLSDSDGNGIELYADRPRSEWPPPPPGGGWRVGMFTRALDLEGLLGTLGGEPPERQADPGLRVGHVHLHVGDLDAALGFYRDTVGLELMAGMPSALFLSAGGYHHHLGVNTWRGLGVGPAPPGAVGLREWTVVLEPAALAGLRERLPLDADAAAADPSGNRVRFVSG
jgi:catechol 2,3-dioxygenase